MLVGKHMTDTQVYKYSVLKNKAQEEYEWMNPKTTGDNIKEVLTTATLVWLGVNAV